MKRLVIALLLFSTPVYAQDKQDVYTTTRKEPRSMFLASVGVAVAAGGFVILGSKDPCCCYPQPTPTQTTGGIAVVGIGVGLMVYGTRLQWVTRVVPSISKHGFSLGYKLR
jgi:hypothetical protein